MAHPVRYLTKSRFKLAAECPRKLYYTGKPDYIDRSVDDSFLAALAEGGYQVGELACLEHPGGIRIDALDHQSALDQTSQLLQQERVTIFEAALSVGTLFVRVDILRKDGQDIELIEVKAKSYSAASDGDFRGKKGQLKADFRPYLLDVAFQRHVVQRALPTTKVRAFLMLVDKDRHASVEGLNQRFKANRVEGRLRIEIAPGTDATSLGQSLLAKVPVDSQVDQLLAENLVVEPGVALPFAQAVEVLADAYAMNQPLPPLPSSACSDCQFKAPHLPDPTERRSGFHECWSQAFGWSAEDFTHGTVLDLWNFRGKNELIARGVLKPEQVSKQDLGFDDAALGPAGMTQKHRQWYACAPTWPGGGDFFFDKAGFAAAAASWRYPLHCIDFETSAVAIPFVRGRRPYEMTAFQFSHHIIAEDGRVQHQTQWLCAEPGVDPNTAFVRALSQALGNDDGTIFRWSAHENTVLNKLRQQLLDATVPVADRDELVAFIERITRRDDDGKEKRIGPRDMVDLCDIASRFYFHPSTKGSNSLKKVLPALMRSSNYLRDTYSRPIYGGQGVSLNFEQPVAWWQERDGAVVDPYLLLPPVFDDVAPEEIETIEEGLSKELREGGAAMAAYGRLQFESLPLAQQAAIRSALLRYCELDTLAMVMAVQAWQNS